MVNFQKLSSIVVFTVSFSFQGLATAEGLNFSKVRNLLNDEVYIHSSTPLTIYQFFASWCIGCSETMKSIEKYTLPKAGSGLSYRVVSIDEKRSDGVEYYNKKIKGKVDRIDAFLWDPTLSLADKLKIDTIPFVALVDAGGNVLWSHTGEMKEKATIQLRALVESHIEKLKNQPNDTAQKSSVTVVTQQQQQPQTTKVESSKKEKSLKLKNSPSAPTRKSSPSPVSGSTKEKSPISSEKKQ